MSRIILLFVGWIAVAVGVAGEPVRFVQLCDTQLGMGGYEADIERFKTAVAAINTLDVSWVVICGDLVNDGNDDQAVADFKAIAAGFTMPVHLVSGNHDVGNEPTEASLARYRGFHGPDYYTVDQGGFRLVVVNTQLWKYDAGAPSRAHDSWFESTVRRAADEGRPLIVAGHYPPFTARPDEDENYYNLPVEKRKGLLEMAKSLGVRAWLAGHAHKNIVLDYGGMPIVVSATTSKNFDEAPHGFRLWTIAEDGTLSHTYQALKLDETGETKSR